MHVLYIWVYAYVCRHACVVYVGICICMQARMCCICGYMHMYAGTHVLYMWVYAYVCRHACMYLHLSIMIFRAYRTIHTCVHAYVHIRTYTYIHTHMHAQVYPMLDTFFEFLKRRTDFFDRNSTLATSMIRECVCVYICVCLYMFVCVCMNELNRTLATCMIRECVYVCVCVCVCAWTNWTEL